MHRFPALWLSPLFLLLLLALPVHADTITIRADLWPPFNGAPNDLKRGYMIDVLQEIYTPLGHKIDYQLLSWDESLKAVRNGEFNAVVGASVDDAPDFVFPQKSFGLNGNSFFVKKGTAWKYTGIPSLAKIRLGIIDSYSYEEEIDNYIKANNGSDRIVSVSGEEALSLLIRLLEGGKIDAIVEDTNVILYTLIKLSVPPGALQLAGKTTELVPLQVAFSPKLKSSRLYAQQFDAGLTRLRKSGRLQMILTRYGLKDWEK